MSHAPSVAFAAGTEPGGAAAAGGDFVSLKGTTRGLEILITGAPTLDALRARLTELLAEAPGFFAGCDARVGFTAPLPGGALACLEDVAAQFQLRLVEIGPAATKRKPAAPRRDTGPVAQVPALPQLPGLPRIADAAPLPEPPGDAAVAYSAPYEAVTIEHAVPSGPVAAPVAVTDSAATAIDTSAGTAMAIELSAVVPVGARLVIGPVRSGVIVEHAGHIVIVGDVNPGAEVRAEGNIIVLGRLRGVAHAATGDATRRRGFILALSLSPQQLRIGRTVARAADADRPSGGAEIAYATGETIVVERFSGRLPSGLAASM